MKAKVSVCVVTYNQSRYIRACLLSVLSQEVDAELEVLVGDAMSDDATPQIIAEIVDLYPGRVRSFRHEVRIGGSDNYHFLIARADGDYIAHLDGDDYWLPGKIAEQLSLLDQEPRAVAVYTNAMVCSEDGRLLGKFNNTLPSTFDLDAMLERGNFLNNSSMLYRGAMRDAMVAMPYPCLDYQFHLNLAQAGLLAYSNKCLVVYRLGAAGSVLLSSSDMVRERYWNALMQVPADRVCDRSWDRMLADFLRRVAFRALRTRRPAMIGKWWSIAAKKARRGRFRLAIATLACVASEAWRQLRQAVFVRWSGAGLRVFYFR